MSSSHRVHGTGRSFSMLLAALMVFALVPWAWWGAVAGLLAGIAGVAAVVLTVKALLRGRMPVGTLLGFLLTGLAATSYGVFLFYWDLGPF